MTLIHILIRINSEIFLILFKEEIFSSNSAMWFSKRGSKIAYASFNDSQIPTMQIPVYGIPGDLKYQYTKIVGVHYPKVRINVFNKCIEKQ